MSRRNLNNRNASWSGRVSTKHHRPAGLKGRDIGMFYKNLQKTQREKKERTITLTIPHPVISSVKNNLEEIIKIANENKIQLPEILTSGLDAKIQDSLSNTTTDSASGSSQFDTNFKAPFEKKSRSTETLEYDPFRPSSSTSNLHLKNNAKQSALRTTQFYKYGYEDIITGTFDEKLQECLSKGIRINFQDQETHDLSHAFYVEYNNMLARSGYKKLLKFREILPAFKKSADVLNLINNNQVIVVSGETGCGKSTQIPQLILDEAIKNNKGANVKILVTQPRRIAASSLAARVAQERCESMGNTVGYCVRLEKVEGRPRGSIQYCTTGVLLVELEVNQGLTNWSHIILDEVHERDCNIDLSMCMLKQVLKRRKDLKLILMSATLDAECLSKYYDDCPVMHIEGLAYPVQDVYLEDILKMTKFKLVGCLQNERRRHRGHQPARRKAEANAMEKDIRYKAEIAGWLEPRQHLLGPDVYRTLQDSRIEDSNLDLMLELLKHICRGDPGAVLIFLPGIGDISTFLRLMKESNFFPSDRYETYPLHSKLPSLEQHRIFEKPPRDIRKIIVATNIAETSITIDDIVYVIDCGRIKINGFNVDQKIVTLNTEWVSQANLRQRRGRAGRCQPGICYHMMTSFRASKLEERVLPELQRSTLLEPVLSIKKLRLGMAVDAFAVMPSPPSPSTVEWAVKHLQQCGAIDSNETLTPLGWHLARLPVHPAAGKLLLLATLFGCLDRAACVAAVWSFKDPFQLVIGKEAEVDDAKRSLTLGEPSDHIAISEAMLRWESCDSRRMKQSFAYDHFLSNNTLELLLDMKRQLGNDLKQMGFLASGNVRSHWENRNSNNLSLFKAIVAASLYPNIASVRWSNIGSQNPNRSPRISVYTPEEGKTTVHPSSVMSPPKPQRGVMTRNHCTNVGANWLVYWLKQRSTDLFLIEVTLTFTLPLLFFGEVVYSDAEEEHPDECFLKIKSINVRCKKETAELLLKLRSLLDLVLASKVTSLKNSSHHSIFEEEVINAVINLITAEDERAEYLDTDFSESDDGDSLKRY